MKTAKILAIVGTLVMFATLVFGFISGDFFKEGSVLMAIAWGKVSLVDVYVGFFLFSGWILFREQNKFVIVTWIITIMVFGNFITCLYTTIALFKSKNDWSKFWMGDK